MISTSSIWNPSTAQYRAFHSPQVISHSTAAKPTSGTGLGCSPSTSIEVATASTAETVKISASTAETAVATVTAVGRSPSARGSRPARASSLRSADRRL